VPEIVGGLVFAGATGLVTPWTTAVWVDVAVLVPALFEAVTATRIVEPTSADVGT
jgi:hypothetical protein